MYLGYKNDVYHRVKILEYRLNRAITQINKHKRLENRINVLTKKFYSLKARLRRGIKVKILVKK